MAEEITRSLTEKEKYQEEVFDKKAGEKKIYAIGGRDNRNHVIKFFRLKKMKVCLKWVSVKGNTPADC